MINVSNHITSELEEQYFLLVKNYLDSNHDRKRNRLTLAITQSNNENSETDKKAFEDFQLNLRKIILAAPQNLLDFDSKDDNIGYFVDVDNYDLFKKRMVYYYNNFMQTKINDIIDTDNPYWEKYNQDTVAYWLLKKLNIRTCPYCNRNYTFTVRTSTGKLARPEFDHFYPKTQKPWLALSLYNLVPSCPTCNHTKKENFISDNPYNNKPSDIAVEYDSINGKVKVVPENNENVKVFGLQQLYEEHVDYAQDVFNKAIAYNPDIYDVLLNSFQGLVKTHEELERLIWGTYLDEEDFDKRPMSKLTSDILKQLGII